MANRYSNFQSYTQDRTGWSPDWDAVDQLLGQQQQLYDVGMSFQDMEIQGHSKDQKRIQEIYQNREDTADHIADVYAKKGIHAGNKMLNEYARTIQKQYRDPSSEIYMIQSNLAKKQAAFKEIDDSDIPQDYKTIRKAHLEQGFTGTHTGEVDDYGKPIFNSYGSADVPEYVDIPKMAMDFAKDHPTHKDAWDNITWVDESGKGVNDPRMGHYIVEKSGKTEKLSAEELMREIAPLIKADQKAQAWLNFQTEMDLFAQGKNPGTMFIANRKNQLEAMQKLERLNSLDGKELQRQINEDFGYDVIKVDGDVGKNTKRARKLLQDQYQEEIEYNPTWGEYKTDYKNSLLGQSVRGAAEFYEVDNLLEMNTSIKADAYRLQDYKDSKVPLLPSFSTPAGQADNPAERIKSADALSATEDRETFKINTELQRLFQENDKLIKLFKDKNLSTTDPRNIFKISKQDLLDAGITNTELLNNSKAKIKNALDQIQKAQDLYNESLYAAQEAGHVDPEKFVESKDDLIKLLPDEIEDDMGLSKQAFLDAFFSNKIQTKSNSRDPDTYWIDIDDGKGGVIKTEIPVHVYRKLLGRDKFLQEGRKARKTYASAINFMDNYVKDATSTVSLVDHSSVRSFPINVNGTMMETDESREEFEELLTNFQNKGVYTLYNYRSGDGESLAFNIRDVYKHYLPKDTNGNVILAGSNLVVSGITKEVDANYETLMYHIRLFPSEGKYKEGGIDIYAPIQEDLQEFIMFGKAGPMAEKNGTGQILLPNIQFNSTRIADWDYDVVMAKAQANPAKKTNVEILTAQGLVNVGHIERQESGDYLYYQPDGMVTDTKGYFAPGKSLQDVLFDVRVAERMMNNGVPEVTIREAVDLLNR